VRFYEFELVEWRFLQFRFNEVMLGCLSLFRIALVEIELMIGLFSVFEVMEPQGNYIEELYDQGENKLT
jgi:hypothetical protein